MNIHTDPMQAPSFAELEAQMLEAAVRAGENHAVGRIKCRMLAGYYVAMTSSVRDGECSGEAVLRGVVYGLAATVMVAGKQLSENSDAPLAECRMLLLKRVTASVLETIERDDAAKLGAYEPTPGGRA